MVSFYVDRLDAMLFRGMGRSRACDENDGGNQPELRGQRHRRASTKSGERGKR